MLGYIVYALLAVQSAGESHVLANPTPNQDDYFAWDVFLAGDLLVVGSPLDDGQAVDAGTVFVYERTGTVWTNTSQLFASDGAAGYSLGVSVSVVEGLMAAGASGADPFGVPNGGSVYIFHYTGSGYTQGAILSASDVESFQQYGRSVDLDNDTLLVGSPLDNDLGISSGSAYIVRRNGPVWFEETKLLASDGQEDDGFGSAVALHGEWAVVGAPAASGHGAVYVFSRESGVWSQQAKLVASDADRGSNFGLSCDIDDGIVVVGAPCFSPPQNPPNKPGAAYVFRRSGTSWVETKLLPMNPHNTGVFGQQVALEGNILACAFPFDDVGATDTGSIYVYSVSSNSLDLLRRLSPSMPLSAYGCGFGGISISGDELAVGAPLEDQNAGSVYIFDLFDTSAVSYCAGKTTSQGCVPFTSASGVPSVSDGAFFVRGQDHVEGRVGMLLYSFKKASLGFHGGTLCVKAPFRRVSTLIQEQDGVLCSSCAGSCRTFKRNFNQWIQSGQDPMLTTGQRVDVQWRQRDPSDPTGFGDNLSDGLSFLIGL